MATVPDAPVITSIIPAATSISVYFSTPYDGGSPITQYVATASDGVDLVSVAGPNSPITISGLNPGTPYFFVVVADNIIGSSVSSDASDYYEPGATVPLQPVITSVVVGDGRATITYTVDNGGAPILQATVTSDPEGRSTTISGVTPTMTVTGLHNLTSYTFTVTVQNSLGQSPVSVLSQTVTPFFPGTFGPAGGLMKAEGATNVTLQSLMQPMRGGHARMVRIQKAVQNQ
jgi:hypothetical protein